MGDGVSNLTKKITLLDKLCLISNAHLTLGGKKYVFFTTFYMSQLNYSYSTIV